MRAMNANRREFIESLGLGAGSLAAMGALSGFSETARGYLANDTINIACIGTGGRCRHLMSRIGKTVQGVRVVAVCDVWDQHLAEGKKMADPQAATSKDFREVLARKDVDAVLIGAPDHWHVPMTVEACKAGKDVYVEKPLTHDPSEGQAVIDAQNNHKRIVQVGTQQRSMPHIQKAAEIIRSGEIGDVRKLHLTWNRNQPRGKKQSYGIDPNSVDWKGFIGNAKEQPFDEYKFRNWRWFWDFGGGIFTDLMVHWIDVAHWILNLDKPTTAASIGDNFISEGLWETPDTVQTLLKYPAGLQAYFEGTFYNARHGSMIEFEGSEATVYIDRGRYEVHPERKKKIEYSELILGKEPATRGADFYDLPDGETLHLANWLECIRSRNKPTAPAEAGVGSAFAAHLANQSLRSGQIAKS
jgi:predicted dehydrogenase